MFRKNIFIPVFLLAVLLTTSCNEYRYSADLEVSVKGFLSGNPREGVLVQLFYSREDAQDLFEPATVLLETNEWGEVFIYDLDPGYDYYVRVDGLLNRVIRNSGKLRSGTNKCSIRIL